MREQQPEQFERVRFPREGETLGIVEQLLGFAKMRVKCLDGKTRICRVPGKLTRTLWVREGDLILVKPWEIQSENRGDVIYKYRKTQINVLKNKGFLKELETEF
jgi:translation initiation factor 1A